MFLRKKILINSFMNQKFLEEIIHKLIFMEILYIMNYRPKKKKKNICLQL